eukprot:scaffold693_cov399-Prasinococcus_capsulatus_cf.AAC.37
MEVRRRQVSHLHTAGACTGTVHLAVVRTSSSAAQHTRQKVRGSQHYSCMGTPTSRSSLYIWFAIRLTYAASPAVAADTEEPFWR